MGNKTSAMKSGERENRISSSSDITTSEAYTHAGVKNVHSSPLEPRILRFSELGEAPPEDDKSTFIEKALLVVFMMTFLTLLIPLVPLILVASLLQRVKVSHQKYHTDANELRIAVIGGGWSGQQCIARLHELGVTHVKGFERNGSYGGTWHEKLRYYSVQIHGAMWITGFKDFAYSNDRDVNDGKVLGEEMLLDFLGRFVREKNLQHAYKYNTRVVGIDYFTSNRKATLKLESTDGSKSWTEEEYDLVIYAAQASEPNIPDIPNREHFKGQIYHTIDFKKDVYYGIFDNDKRVAIVGGSKAGCDAALCFHRSDYNNFKWIYYNNFKWIYRKPYIFLKYENMCHDRSLVNSLRGIVTIVATLLSTVSLQLAGWLLWTSGMAVTFAKEKHNDWNKFHFGILCPRQRKDLRSISQSHIVQANPVAYTSTGLKLADETTVDADVIVWATGCQTGIDKIELTKDGKAYGFDPDCKMLDHFIFPTFSVLANSSSLWTTFGPMRAVNSAEMAIKHLCIHERRTEESMVRSASGNSTNAVSGWLFQSKTNAMATFVKMHLDLIFSGHVNILDFVNHIIEIFCFSKQTPLKLRLPPK